MGTLVMVGQLILSLSILIVLHEGGHFLPAKWFGTRVEKFYLFFDPWFELFKFKHGETEYGIGWLPFGGYVKISGMIDESFDTEALAQEPQPWEFRSKPAWQRLIIMLGGVTVNFVLGLLIFIGILFTWGETFLPAKNAIYGISTSELGEKFGLQEGDKILKVGGEPFDKFEPTQLIKNVIFEDNPTITVERGGAVETFDVPKEVKGIVTSRENQRKNLIYPRTPFIAGAFSKGAPAEKAGLKLEDKIIAFNNTPTPFFKDFRELAKNQKDKDIKVTVIRSKKDTMVIDIHTDTSGRIGVAPYGYDHFFDIDTTHYSFAESIPAGISKGINSLTEQIKAIGQIVTGGLSAKDNLGSVFTIAKQYGTVWDWHRFWSLTGLLSLLLAFLNLLPIPALDGGHVMFLLYEVISGRKPSDKVMEYATIAGFLLLVCLMVFVLGLDIWNNFFR